MTDQHAMSQEFQGMFSSPECDSTEAERIVFPSGYLFQVTHYVNKSVMYAVQHFVAYYSVKSSRDFPQGNVQACSCCRNSYLSAAVMGVSCSSKPYLVVLMAISSHNRDLNRCQKYNFSSTRQILSTNKMSVCVCARARTRTCVCVCGYVV